jgi:hypothetical protein
MVLGALTFYKIWPGIHRYSPVFTGIHRYSPTLTPGIMKEKCYLLPTFYKFRLKYCSSALGLRFIGDLLRTAGGGGTVKYFPRSAKWKWYLFKKIIVTFALLKYWFLVFELLKTNLLESTNNFGLFIILEFVFFPNFLLLTSTILNTASDIDYWPNVVSVRDKHFSFFYSTTKTKSTTIETTNCNLNFW